LLRRRCFGVRQSASLSPVRIIHNQLTLIPGTRLGVFEIAAQIGTGGMGEVYRATDTNLKRAVALKVLPASVGEDAERLVRFQREAEVLAALNHPNIAQIYGLEKSGGIAALVMELVDGPTLADRIAQGPVPVEETLAVAKQIAEALEAAHEQGIVHRDLKPTNIKVRPDGVVKVLDFGLAKVMEPADAMAPNVTQSPTITPAMTHVGFIVGTAAYMPPEQAKGRPADKRADIWAFGVVVFEMLTGQGVFTGDTVSDTLASVLKTDPNWRSLPAAVPPRLRALLRWCLDKDPKRRLRDIGDARVQIEDLLGGASDETGSVIVGDVRIERRVTHLAVAMLVGALAATALLWTVSRPTPPEVFSLEASPPDSAALSIDGSARDISVTPDGSNIVYIGNHGTQLFVRSLTKFEPVAILSESGTLRGVFTSPDGDWVGFVQGTNTLRKVAITGGAPNTLLTMDGDSLGAVWGSDNRIVFATANPATGLQRVSMRGGTVEVLTTPDRAGGAADHLWPEILPNDRGVLFTITAVRGGLSDAQIAVRDSSGTIKTLLHGGHHAHYVPGGHLVFAVGGALRAVGFDLDRLEVLGTPVEVVPHLATTATGAADFAVAANGMLVYVDAPGAAAGLTPTWVDRAGNETPTGVPPGSYQYPRLTPNGTGITLNVSGDRSVIWDLPGGPLRRQPGPGAGALLSADGKHLIFSSTQGRPASNLYRQAANGAGVPERLTDSPNTQVATSMTRDGVVIFHEITPAGDRNLYRLTLPQPGELGRSRELIATPDDERNGIVSPDGRWFAYESDRSGQFEIYVRPFPNLEAGEWQVSAGGGRQAVWTRQELFYVALDGSLVVVPVNARGFDWSAGTPQKFLDNRYFSSGGVPRQYDVAPDGQRVLVLKQGSDQGSPQIRVVSNWPIELGVIAPIK
jgi:serine/threonine-protein kinase